MRIVLLGAPGSGKGTQSQCLAARHGIPQVSTGDLLRAAVVRGTPFGVKAKEAMAAGRLVEDKIVLGMIRERLSQPDARAGFILDGFPRNIAQARALDLLLRELRQPLDAVVEFDVDNAELSRRISGRRTCADCGRVLNLLTAAPGEVERELCPKTGRPHRLFQRPDDNEATVTERLRVYEAQTRPVADFYREQGLLRVIDAQGEISDVSRRLDNALGGAMRGKRPSAKRGGRRTKRPAARLKRARAGRAGDGSAARASSKPESRRAKTKVRAAKRPSGRRVRAKRAR